MSEQEAAAESQPLSPEIVEAAARHPAVLAFGRVLTFQGQFEKLEAAKELIRIKAAEELERIEAEQKKLRDLQLSAVFEGDESLTASLALAPLLRAVDTIHDTEESDDEPPE